MRDLGHMASTGVQGVAGKKAKAPRNLFKCKILYSNLIWVNKDCSNCSCTTYLPKLVQPPRGQAAFGTWTVWLQSTGFPLWTTLFLLKRIYERDDVFIAPVLSPYRSYQLGGFPLLIYSWREYLLSACLQENSSAWCPGSFACTHKDLACTCSNHSPLGLDRMPCSPSGTQEHVRLPESCSEAISPHHSISYHETISYHLRGSNDI